MNFYLFLKTVHIISIISWMAAILYLYRLFIYHVEWGAKSSDNHEMLSVMERRLTYFIMHPAMGLSWIAGISMMVMNPLLLKQGWLHSKLLFVVFLTFTTIYAGRLHKKLKNKEKISLSSKQLRFLNEVPTVLMILIVAFVVFKP